MPRPRRAARCPMRERLAIIVSAHDSRLKRGCVSPRCCRGGGCGQLLRAGPLDDAYRRRRSVYYHQFSDTVARRAVQSRLLSGGARLKVPPRAHARWRRVRRCRRNVGHLMRWCWRVMSAQPARVHCERAASGNACGGLQPHGFRLHAAVLVEERQAMRRRMMIAKTDGDNLAPAPRRDRHTFRECRQGASLRLTAESDEAGVGKVDALKIDVERFRGPRVTGSPGRGRSRCGRARCDRASPPVRNEWLPIVLPTCGARLREAGRPAATRCCARLNRRRHIAGPSVEKESDPDQDGVSR